MVRKTVTGVHSNPGYSQEFCWLHVASVPISRCISVNSPGKRQMWMRTSEFWLLIVTLAFLDLLCFGIPSRITHCTEVLTLSLFDLKPFSVKLVDLPKHLKRYSKTKKGENNLARRSKAGTTHYLAWLGWLGLLLGLWSAFNHCYLVISPVKVYC